MVNAKSSILFCSVFTLILVPGCVGEKQEPQPKMEAKKAKAAEPKKEVKAPAKKQEAKKQEKKKEQKKAQPAVNRSVQEVETMDEYYEIINNGNPSFVFAHSHSCPPCKMTEPEVQKAAKKLGDKVNFVSILTTNRALDEIFDNLGVESIPTTVFLNKNGKEVHRNVGALKQTEIEKMIKENCKVQP